MQSRRLLVTVGLVLAVLMGLGLAACSNDSSVTPVSPSQAAEIAQQTGVTVVDVRTPAEYESGHLAGAINIDVEGATFDQQVAQLPKDGTYLVYCHSGNRSGVATEAMAKAGFTHVDDLQGGIEAWTASGGELVTN